MKVISVVGIKGSGKTTVCETIISGLVKRGYTVGSVKEIHMEDFTIDIPENTNTNKHRMAGATLVTARGMKETDVLFQSKLPIEQILKNYTQDYVVLEGVYDCNCPIIITAHTLEEVELKKDCRTVAVSGKLSGKMSGSINGIQIVKTFEEREKLVDIAEKMAIEPIPNFDKECCGRCGMTCLEFTGEIISGKMRRDACIINENEIELKIDGVKVGMVPFVQNILKNELLGVVKELRGFNPNSKIEVTMK